MSLTAKLRAPKISGWKATAAVSMSNYLEAGAIIAIATSLGFWQDEFGFSDSGAGLLAAFSANAFGAAIGAAIGGPLCDKYGRKFIYTYDLILYMIGMLIAVFAVNFQMLFVAFLIAGVSVGAGVTAGWTYIAEQAPHKDRARHIGAAQLAWSVGPAIGFLLATFLAPMGLMGSRIIFFHLFVVALISWWIRQGIEESKLWKDTKSIPSLNESRTYIYTQRFWNATNVKAIIFLVLVYGMWNLVAGQAGIFMPRIYETAGLTSVVEQNLLQVGVWTFTSLSTYFLFMKLADRVSRKWLYFAGAALGIVAWIFLVFSNGGLFNLMMFALFWGISSGIGAQAFYAVWSAELFSTVFRARAQGILFCVVRVLVGLLSYAFPVLLTQQGASRVGMLMIFFLVIAMIIGTVWAPKTQGKTMTEIEEERYGLEAQQR